VGAFGVGLGGQRGGRLGDVDLVRVFRVGLVAEEVVDAGGNGLGVRGGADVDLRWVPVEVQVLLCGREAAQDCGGNLPGRGGGGEREAAGPGSARRGAARLAVPRAESPGRSLRVGSGTAASPARSPGLSRAGTGVAQTAVPAGYPDVMVMGLPPEGARARRW